MKKAKPLFLVTGATGFLGKCFLFLLEKKSPSTKVVAVSRKWTPENTRWKGIEFIEGDLRASETWRAVPAAVTHVFHLAAKIPYLPEEKINVAVISDNLVPIANLVAASRDWPDLEQVVYSSSISVYAQTLEPCLETQVPAPSDFYGAAKLAGESLLSILRNRKIKIASLRFSSLYGKGQYPATVLPKMVRDMTRKGEIQIHGTGKRTQDFLACEDAAMALWSAYEKKVDGVLNIGAGTPTSMKVLAETIDQVFAEGKGKLNFLTDVKTCEIGYKMDTKKAQKVLRFRPRISLIKGLQNLKQEMETVHI